MINSPIGFFLNSYGVLILLLGVFSYLYFKKSKRQAILLLISAAATSFITILLKELFDMPRPFIQNGGSTLAFYLTFGSLPSLHTALAFCIATSVSLKRRSLGVALFLVATLIGLGRIVANVHYPADIAIGAILGSTVALFVDKLKLKTS